MDTSSTHLQSTVPLIGRVLLALIFIVSGLSKLAAPAATQSYIVSAGLPFPQLAYVAAVTIEILGGVLLLVGYRTRIVAWVLAGFALMAGAAFHHALGDQSQFIHLLKNLAIAGGMLQVAAFGPGRFSIDERSASRAVPDHATRVTA